MPIHFHPRHVRVPKLVRQMAISASVLTGLMVIGGVIYVYVMDQAANNQPIIAPTANVATQNQTLQPPAVAPNAAESAAIELLTSPVTPGAAASMSVQTNPGSSCTIAVAYDKANSTAAGLIPETADAYGAVTWNWVVEPRAPLGTWPVNVTCAFHGRTGFVQGNLQISATAQ